MTDEQPDYDPVYEPILLEHRVRLASALLTRFATAGFADAGVRGQERVFARDHHAVPGARVLVYSSIVGHACRGVGEDAIRVVGLYQGPEREIPIAKAESRVFRVGTVSAIVARMLKRMREVYGTIGELPRCRSCGAPKATAKSGMPYCLALCWKQRERQRAEDQRHAHRDAIRGDTEAENPGAD